jgi:maleylacetoacetate isomerase/maleylpyruvate isomerase
MQKIQLYNYFRSSTSFRVRIALHLKKLDFEYIPVHLLQNGGEQNAEAYRKLNPVGGVPTLVHGDLVISQSFAILEYLDEAFPQTYQLLPTDIYLRAKIRQFCENINADIHPMNNLKLMQYLEKKHHYDQTQKDEWCQKWIHDGFMAAEKILAPFAKTYCFGDSLTAADLFLVPQMLTGDRFHLKTSDYKMLYEITQRCLKLEAFDKAHPSKQIDTPPEFKT